MPLCRGALESSESSEFAILNNSEWGEFSRALKVLATQAQITCCVAARSSIPSKGNVALLLCLRFL
jgi:hypothetical protein